MKKLEYDGKKCNNVREKGLILQSKKYTYLLNKLSIFLVAITLLTSTIVVAQTDNSVIQEQPQIEIKEFQYSESGNSLKNEIIRILNNNDESANKGKTISNLLKVYSDNIVSNLEIQMIIIDLMTDSSLNTTAVNIIKNVAKEYNVEVNGQQKPSNNDKELKKMQENDSLMIEEAKKRELVIAEMNSCIMSVTNIINQQSFYILEHETDQLLNNLTMEQIKDLKEIQNFRITLNKKLGNLTITAEERRVLNRVNNMKKDALKWQAISNALSPTMLLVPGNIGPQMIFNTLLSAARAGVEYKVSKNEYNQQELKSLWELKKIELKEYTDLRGTAMNTMFGLFTRFDLEERDRLTESTFNDFVNTCNDPDNERRLRELKRNEKNYQMIRDYYYHLGMAYIDNEDYNNAKPNLLKYISVSLDNPIYRCDEKLGCAAMAMLSIEDSLSIVEQERYINMVLDNLPNNGAALIQCAMYYIRNGENEYVRKAYELLIGGIDNPKMDNKDLIIYCVANNVNLVMEKFPDLFNSVQSAIESVDDVNINCIIPYILNACDRKYWKQIFDDIIHPTIFVSKQEEGSLWWKKDVYKPTEDFDLIIDYYRVIVIIYLLTVNANVVTILKLRNWIIGINTGLQKGNYTIKSKLSRTTRN